MKVCDCCLKETVKDTDGRRPLMLEGNSFFFSFNKKTAFGPGIGGDRLKAAGHLCPDCHDKLVETTKRMLGSFNIDTEADHYREVGSL